MTVSRIYRPFSPRLERAGRVEEALQGMGWDSTRWPGIGPPPIGSEGRNRPIRRTLKKVAERTVLLDRSEIEAHLARRRLDRGEVDAGYLVVPAFSPAVIAASVLRSRGRPYVVDSGDPWLVGDFAKRPRAPVVSRRKRAERDLLAGAAGIVVTSDLQADLIGRDFPGIPLLVRPNGFQSPEEAPRSSDAAPDPDVLRLVHFGRFDGSVRVDPMPFLRALADSGKWQRVVFTQFGPDPRELPRPDRSDIEIVARGLLPWSEVLGEARSHDAAIVLGNLPERRMQLPSKTIEYLGLPIPRIALSSGEDDSLFRYARDLPGYLVLTEGDDRTASKVAAHIEGKWDRKELEPPQRESWESVAVEIASFVDSCLRRSMQSRSGLRSSEAGASVA